MDKVAYEYFKRYMDMQKKGDATDSAASIMALTATGGRGEGFDWSSRNSIPKIEARCYCRCPKLLQPR